MEKRLQARMHVYSYICINEQESDRNIGQLRDITTQGMRLYGDTPLEPYTRYRFKMKLPGNNSKPYEIKFDADVVWCRKDKLFDTWDAGIQLTDLKPVDREAIEQFMQNATFEERWLTGKKIK